MDTRTLDPGLPKGPSYPPGNPMGVDLSALSDLPTDLRGRAIRALQDLQDAIALNDPEASTKATSEVADIIAEIQRIRAEAATNKLFHGRPDARGTHDVMKFFARRAGVAA